MRDVHPGVIRLDGDNATGRACIQECGRMRDGACHLHCALYHDHYQRTPDG
ncbi:hypothetical protein [Streptomyces sp. IBSBF 2806]|uniref:hypothetical protein n=1 Tax=Streptomyces sp. IBSBF 2806 TaxID=2903529 RepID=UPI002FDC410B